MHSDDTSVQDLVRQPDLLRVVVDRLEVDPLDRLAIIYLVNFDAADRQESRLALSPEHEAIRSSLRRLASALLVKHSSGGDAELRQELVTIRSLIGHVQAPKKRSKVRLLALGSLCLLVGGGISAGVLLPGRVDERRDLAKAEATIDDLENRVAAVANEKALEQDERAYAEAAAAELAAIAQAASQVNDDLELCVDYGNNALQLAIDLGNGYTVDDYQFQQFLDAWSTTCREARESAADLRGLLG